MTSRYPFPTLVSPVVSPLNRHDASDSSGGVRSRLRVSSGNDDSAMDIVQGASAIGSVTNVAMAMTSTTSNSLDHAVPPSTVILPPAPARYLFVLLWNSSKTTHLLCTSRRLIEKARELIKNDFPFFLEAYDNYRYDIQRVDAIRYSSCISSEGCTRIWIMNH